MQFTPDKYRAKWETHASRAATSRGASISVTAQDNLAQTAEVRLSASASGCNCFMYFTPAEAKALAAELLAAADAQSVQEAA